MVRDEISVEPYITQVREMADAAKKAGLNIDYFPTNFVVKDNLIYYVDYECNQYMVGDRIRNRAKKCEVYAFDEMTRGYGNDINRQERIETFSQRAYDLAKGLR